MMSINTEIAEYFDRHAERYDELVSTVDFQLNDAYQYLADYVLHSTRDRDTRRILELGTGTGKLTKFLLESGENVVVTGVDSSAQMLEQAAANLREHEDRLSLVRGEFPDSIPDAEYDCVVSAIALSFYPIDYVALFRKVHRLLRKGGLFVYAANVAQNVSSVDDILTKMLTEKITINKEQLQWLKSIRGETDIYQVPGEWHPAQLRQGGFMDVDCIYLRYKLGIFSGAKPKVAL